VILASSDVLVQLLLLAFLVVVVSCMVVIVVVCSLAFRVVLDSCATPAKTVHPAHPHDLLVSCTKFIAIIDVSVIL